MIDTHCHLLPALDDGPRDLDESVHLARQLVETGVTYVLCTPHLSRLFPTTVSTARERLGELRAALFAAEIPLKLGLASEVSPVFSVTAPASELLVRSVGGFLLVELEPDTPVGFLTTALDRLEEDDLRPVFAHPERSRALRGQARLLDEARARGALVQVVAPSLTGRWGGETQAAAWRFLDAGCVDLLASDAHRARRRQPHLAHAAELVEARLGPEALRDLTERAPARLLGPSRQPV